MSLKMERVELHVYTRHTMSGVSDALESIKRAENLGLCGIGFTDLGTTAGLYDLQRYNWHSPGKEIIQTICGAEVYIVDDYHHGITDNIKPETNFRNYVVLDIETTGLSATKDEIIEIAALYIEDGWTKREYHSFVKPEKAIPDEITTLTGIGEDDVKDAPPIGEVLPVLLDFIGDNVVIGYNVGFDISFLSVKAGRNLGIATVDVLHLARTLLPELKKHTLGAVAEELGLSGGSHRAMDDAKATAKVFGKLLLDVKERRIYPMEDMNRCLAFQFPIPYPMKAVILARDEEGMRNINALLSDAELTSKKDNLPCIRKSCLDKHHDGILIGSSALGGEVIQAFLDGANEDDITELMNLYDYAEICPIDTLISYLNRDSERYSEEELREVVRRMYDVCNEERYPLVAVSCAYYADEHEAAAHEIAAEYLELPAIKNAYIRSTEHMMKEFSFLEEEQAYHIVVNNTNKLADMISLTMPQPEDREKPVLYHGSEEMLKNLSYGEAQRIYGEDMPVLVRERLERELHGITSNGYAEKYLTMHELIDKSGLRLGEYNFRGCCGNSFVAWLLKISGEVNPLIPHYRCASADYVEFPDADLSYGCDLPRKTCPYCGKELIRDGFSLTEYFFTGLNHDKSPDFDLNVVSSKRDKAYSVIPHLKGVRDAVFCGTTHTSLLNSKIRDMADDYANKNEELMDDSSKEEIIGRLGEMVSGYGKHPGGVLLIPDYVGRAEENFYIRKDKSGKRVSAANYRYLDNIFEKVDILWYSALDHLSRIADITGVPVESISLDDPEVISEFKLEDTEKVDGLIGLYDLWTYLASELMQVCGVRGFGDLVKIMGLTHGTEVWFDNADKLISDNVTTIDNLIADRDDIYDYLIKVGLDEETSFKIAERVRKGKGLLPEQEENLKEQGVPAWYTESCNKVRYLFPRAHSISYAIVLWRLAYYRKHYPEQYYRAYLESAHISDDTWERIQAGDEAICARLEEISIEEVDDDEPQDNSEQHALLVASHMYEMGYRIPKMR